MRKRKIILITSLFLLILTGLHLAWNYKHMRSDYPSAKKGVLDLRKYKFTDDHSILLNGQWIFYPNQFLTSKGLNDWSSRTDRTLINVPDDWQNTLSKDRNSSFGYGTYRLRILLNDTEKQVVHRMFISNIQTAATIYINGKVAGESGHPSESKVLSKPFIRPIFVLVEKGATKIDLMIHVSNFENPKLGGIVGAIQLGKDKTMIKEKFVSYALQFVVVILLLLHSVYLFISYLLFGRKREMLFLVVAFFCLSLATATYDDKILLYILPFITYEWWAKISNSSYIVSVLFFVLSIRIFFPNFKKSLIFRGYTIFSILFVLWVIFLPTQYTFVLNEYVLLIILLFPISIISIIIFRIVLSGQRGSIYLLLTMLSIEYSVIWGFSKDMTEMNIPYYPFDMMMGVLFSAIYWFKQYFYVTRDSQEYAEKLKRMDKKKDDFLANTSHELRNPLHGIINMAQALFDNEKNHLDEESKKNLRLLISVGKRMSRMLDDLLDMTRLKEGRINLEISSVNVTSIVSGVFDMLQYMKEGKHLQFVLDIPIGFPNVQADENRLIQIFFNLIYNAVKFSNEGKITVSAEIAKGMAVIHVEDSGIGMNPQTLNRIFEPYEQGDSGITSTGGIGLGLSICKQLVELHGGNISVRTVMNEGSTFTFTLPLADDIPFEKNNQQAFTEVATDMLVTEKDVIHTESPRILVIDDDSVNILIYKQLLVSEQYNVVTCTSGKEALDVLNKGRFDLVISDVMMPYLSGYELTRKIRERFSVSELPVLLLTARSRPEDVQAGFDAGANDYITKPVEKSVFITRVRALTDIKKSVHERVRMEAAWLQAQIQPHFLFNTLNTIAALSKINPTKMLDLLHEFGNYLRASFDIRNIETVVPLKAELELVRSYLYIEQERFKDRLSVEWELNEGMSVQVPPLSIQTLVENAVKHGVLKRPEGGTVRIQVKDQPEYIQITIIDNGVGMSQDKIQQLLSGKADQVQGIGVPNTDKRLKQIFGQGLIISSALNQGTSVTMMIPKEILYE